MSQENVEVIKRAVEASNRKDYDAVLDAFDPDVEWRAVFQVMFEGQTSVYRGHEGVRAYLRDIDEAFSERQVEISEYRDLGDRIVAIGHVRGRGSASGAELDSPLSYLAEFKNGRITRIRDYFDANEALEAAGLSE